MFCEVKPWTFAIEQQARKIRDLCLVVGDHAVHDLSIVPVSTTSQFKRYQSNVLGHSLGVAGRKIYSGLAIADDIDRQVAVVFGVPHALDGVLGYAIPRCLFSAKDLRWARFTVSGPFFLDDLLASFGSSG